MMEFKTDSIFEALKSPLGVIDDEERRRQIEGYIEAARLPLERAVFDLLSQFGEAVNDEVSAHYTVALTYRSGVLKLSVQPAESEDGEDTAWSMADGEVEKVTLRIPAELKELASEAAAQASLSANSWFVKTLSRHLQKARKREEGHLRGRRRNRRGGQKLSGWVGGEDDDD